MGNLCGWELGFEAILRHKEITMSEHLQLTVVFMQVREGYIAFDEELPGANTQGNTLEDARVNLQEVVELSLEANREMAEKSPAGQAVIREPFTLIAP
jgi:predicted RNase H-like HicB family nuclease